MWIVVLMQICVSVLEFIFEQHHHRNITIATYDSAHNTFYDATMMIIVYAMEKSTIPKRENYLRIIFMCSRLLWINNEHISQN